MKNNMKKIIVAGLALAILLTGSQSVFASGPFNGQSGDCNPGIGIGNYSKNNIPRDSQGCWSSTSISADAGDTINVAMYYHNNTGSTLNNVRGSIVKSTYGPANTYTFTGTMYSDQGSQNIGTVTLNLSSSQTLTYSSTHIMKGSNAVINDQDTSVVTNDDGQISIGSVPTGWDNYGEILAVFKVGTNNSNYNTCNDTSATNYGGSLPCNYYNNYNNTCRDTSAYNYGGTLPCYYNNNNNYNYIPSVSTYAPLNVTSTSATLSGYVNANGSYVTSWFEFPCYGTKYYNQASSNSLSSYVSSLSPNTTYTYCAVAQANNGQTYRGSSVSFTSLGGTIYQPVYTNNANVVTTIATNVSRSSATLNGYITNSNYYNSNVYFEYGTSANLGSRTTTRTSNGNSAFNESIDGLSPDTIYFFRAVSEGSNGTSRGTVEIFKTPGSTSTTPVFIQGTTVVGTSSPIMLKIEDRYAAIGEGDTVDYTVSYKNIGKVTLLRPVLQVIIPKGITLTNYTAGTYATDTNTLTIPLIDLVPGAEGYVNVQGKVVTMPTDTAQVVSTAVLVYTNKSGAQENAMAYVLNNPKTLTNSLLGASAFFGGIFPTSLIGWLFLIILVLLLVMIARTLYHKQTVNHTEVH